MKVLMLNTFDDVGGAARAAVRLQKGVRAQGIEADLLVQFKSGSDRAVLSDSTSLRKAVRRLKVFLGMLPVRLYPHSPENNFSPALLPDTLSARIGKIDPDIVHLHWMGAGFLRVETLPRLDKPLLWTLHDSWPFSGGCHVPFDCKRYQQSCGACPVLGSSREADLSRWTWQRKARAWRDLNLTVVAPSRWLADCARSSSLFGRARVEVIPNGLDVAAFRPRDKEHSRNALNLPKEKKIILFGAVRSISDPNKGFQLLQPALRVLAGGIPDLLALVFGAPDSGDIPDLGMPLVSLGEIRDDQLLAAIYSAADVFVAPSIQENLPNTILEAMACGTPSVAFRQGGVPDLIEHERSGYLARAFEVEDLAHGIAWVVGDRARHAELSARARAKAKSQFDLRKVSERYIALYRELLAQGKRSQGTGFN